MKLLVDLNLSPAWAKLLCEQGFDAEHWSTLGPLTAPDAVLMAHARRTGAVILTQDLDFGAILAATGGVAPSVVQLRADDLRPAVIGPFVCTVLRRLEADLAVGALVSIEPGRTRSRVLPLRNPSTDPGS